jgi:flagellar basal-body rod protein FlgF
MDTTGYVSLSHQLALQRQLDMIAGNIANADTTGYRRENALFQSYLEHQPNTSTPAARNVSFVLDYGIARDSGQGELAQTNNPLDVAIVGDAFFTVGLANGETAYTRNGHFSVSEDGYLTSVNGTQVLDSRGSPFQFQPDEKKISISKDGTVSTSAGDIGQIALARFANDAQLERLGDTLYQGTGALAVNVSQANLRIGYLEKSNVKPIVETTEMMNILRSYQATTSLLDRYDELRKRGIERLGRIN